MADAHVALLGDTGDVGGQDQVGAIGEDGCGLCRQGFLGEDIEGGTAKMARLERIGEGGRVSSH